MHTRGFIGKKWTSKEAIVLRAHMLLFFQSKNGNFVKKWQDKGKGPELLGVVNGGKVTGTYVEKANGRQGLF